MGHSYSSSAGRYEDHAAQMAKQREERLERQSHLIEVDGRAYHPNPAKGHGHNKSYAHDGCRCPACTKAASEYRKGQRSRSRSKRLKPQDRNLTVDPSTVFKF